MDAPIFVVGTPRSGTTLTARILGTHSRIFMPGETHYFDDIYARRSELGALKEPSAADAIIKRLCTIYDRYNEAADQRRIDAIFKDPTLIADFKTRCNSYRDVYSWFMKMQMRHEGKARWGNQVPRDIFNTSDILSFYPEAKFIVCIRDIRDFLVSYKNKWKTAKQEKNRARLKAIYHPVMTSLLWKSSLKHVDRLLHLVPAGNRIVVPYEKLVLSPEQTTREICRCIGEQYEDSMLSVNFSNSSFDGGHEGIFKTSIGRWHKDLTAEEVAVAQKIGARELLNNGYDIIAVRCNLFKLSILLMGTPCAFYRGMEVNKNLRGATLKYLLKRLRPLLN